MLYNGADNNVYVIQRRITAEDHGQTKFYIYENLFAFNTEQEAKDWKEYFESKTEIERGAANLDIVISKLPLAVMRSKESIKFEEENRLSTEDE